MRRESGKPQRAKDRLWRMQGHELLGRKRQRCGDGLRGQWCATQAEEVEVKRLMGPEQRAGTQASS